MEANLDVLVEDWDGDLALEGDRPPSELDDQGVFVDGLEEAGAELLVDGDGGADDGTGYLFVFECQGVPSEVIVLPALPAFLSGFHRWMN